MKVTKKSFKKLSKKIINIKPITSVEEYIAYVKYLEKDTSALLWYRGVQKVQYDLRPGAYRFTISGEELLDLTNSFIHKSKHLVARNYQEKWEWYQLMQHHGMPTRLLDWTEGSLIALYFAVRDTYQYSRPCVWVLDPYELNDLSTGKEQIYYTDSVTRDEEDQEIVEKYENELTLEGEFPIAVVPPTIHERMHAQKSCFTIHGKVRAGFEGLFKKRDLKLYQLQIKAGKVLEIKDSLNRLGISESTLFPDLEGVAREIKS